MAFAGMDVEYGLVQIAHRLSFPPFATADLLSLLDETQIFLSKVDQSSSKSMSAAIRPAMEALVAKNLIKHSQEDVRVAVASCISEITRITAPNAPYSDDQMRVIFKLIVDTFGKLDDMSSRSLSKRILILEIAARVRSCVMMLDLECDTLIVDMFRHFIKTIRPDHPDKVFECMVIIMTLVLEECEECESDVTRELVYCLLDGVRKDNKEVLPIASRLAGEVLGNCAGQIKSFLMQVNSLDGVRKDNKEVLPIARRLAGEVLGNCAGQIKSFWMQVNSDWRASRQQIFQIDGQLQESLISGLESISNMMKEVELCEKKANKAKEEASKAGEEILSKVEELRKMMKHEKKTNDHNEKVYAENDIFVTGSQGLLSRLLSLSEERNKSSLIIQQIHQSLETRLVAAEKELAAAEQQKLEKEESADKLLNEQQLLTKDMVEQSRMLMQEEENTKLSKLLIEGGHIVDELVKEAILAQEYVSSLQKRIGDHC